MAQVVSTDSGQGPRTFRKRPVTVQALQWSGANEAELDEFCRHIIAWQDSHLGVLPIIATPAGFTRIHPGQWVTRYDDGRVEVVAPDAFERAFEEVEEAR